MLISLDWNNHAWSVWASHSLSHSQHDWYVLFLTRSECAQAGNISNIILFKNSCSDNWNRISWSVCSNLTKVREGVNRTHQYTIAQGSTCTCHKGHMKHTHHSPGEINVSWQSSPSCTHLCVNHLIWVECKLENMHWRQPRKQIIPQINWLQGRIYQWAKNTFKKCLCLVYVYFFLRFLTIALNAFAVECGKSKGMHMKMAQTEIYLYLHSCVFSLSAQSHIHLCQLLISINLCMWV